VEGNPLLFELMGLGIPTGWRPVDTTSDDAYKALSILPWANLSRNRDLIWALDLITTRAPHSGSSTLAAHPSSQRSDPSAWPPQLNRPTRVKSAFPGWKPKQHSQAPLCSHTAEGKKRRIPLDRGDPPSPTRPNGRLLERKAYPSYAAKGIRSSQRSQVQAPRSSSSRYLWDRK